MKQASKSQRLNNIIQLKKLRKELRKNLMPAEAKLWTCLKNSQLENRKFRRQHSVDCYILDFFYLSESLAIELDGEGHNGLSQRKYDKERDEFLRDKGIKVLRIENKLVFENLSGVLRRIKNEFKFINSSRDL